MIQIPLTPEAYAAATKIIADKHGIVMTDEGTITKMGVTASYKFDGSTLSIAILEKPFFVTTEYCEDQIKSLIAAG